MEMRATSLAEDGPWRDRDLNEKHRKGVFDEFNRDTRLRWVNCNRTENGS